MSKSVKIALIIGAIAIVLLVITPLAYGLAAGWENWGCGFAQSGTTGPWMMTGLGGWSMMGIFWLVIVGLIVWLIVTLVRSNVTTNPNNTSGNVQVLEILKTRYASGEINKEEFEEKLKDLA